jgi:hypothetical protein
MRGESFSKPARGDFEELFMRSVRKTCSECGSADLWWGTSAGLLRLRLEQSEGEAVDELNDLLQMGGELGGSKVSSWMCNVCRHWGMFGPLESERG